MVAVAKAIQTEQFRERRLHRRLVNWGNWLHHEAEIGPKPARCVSIESRHKPEVGDTVDEDRRAETPVPDVTDAEQMQEYIRQLCTIEQYVLAVSYGGMPCVMRFRRVSDAHMKHALENAEINLAELIKKR